MKTIQPHKSSTFKTLGLVALVAAVLACTSTALLASPVTLTVTLSSDTLPGGQMESATSGDLRYCINYILNQQAQGITQDYEVVFASGVTSIQLSAKLSMVNLLGSDTNASYLSEESAILLLFCYYLSKWVSEGDRLGDSPPLRNLFGRAARGGV